MDLHQRGNPLHLEGARQRLFVGITWSLAELVARVVVTFLVLFTVSVGLVKVFPELLTDYYEDLIGIMSVILFAVIGASLIHRYLKWDNPVGYPDDIPPSADAYRFFFVHSTVFGAYVTILATGLCVFFATENAIPISALTWADWVIIAIFWLAITVTKFGALLWHRKRWLTPACHMALPAEGFGILAFTIGGMIALIGVATYLGAQATDITTPERWAVIFVALVVAAVGEGMLYCWAREDAFGKVTYLRS